MPDAEEEVPPEEGKGKGKKGKGKGKELAVKGKGKGKKGKGKGKMKGGGQVMVREKVVYQRKSRNAGIHTIEIYHPQFYLKQIEQEEYDARPDRFGPSVIGKYTKGVGQVEARFPTDDEDPVSFAMTSTHRLLERMQEKGFNETGKYQPDGVALNIYNAVGRLDVGTESITDRSKSMKSYVMDIFERYGDHESNIEGVDQYNACYGGQACGLCSLSWVESDRWDGRYGIAVATDISEADASFMAFVGAACTATLFFPDAPLAHHSQRASCILHRFDFFKPVGWHRMAPITEGKYSVECYLEALDACHKNLRKKLNDRMVLEITDYNVFHTGGGYHIVRKAFERMLRGERPDCKGEEKEQIVDVKLHPSVSLLKIIGPCHTVSSFLNTSSIVMNTMDASLGKVICVYTYGSGCASTMYQMRIDDVAYFDPMDLWKVKFYRHSIHRTPEAASIHGFYTETWMKFDYRPMGRKVFGIPQWIWLKDVYALMEIDKFGRRFYHRGGLSVGPLPKEQQNILDIEKSEGRKRRQEFGPIPVDAEKPEDEKPSIEDLWREIEYDMRFDAEAVKQMQEEKVVKDRYNDQMVHIIKPTVDFSQVLSLDNDGKPHTYQIVGTWSKCQPVDMTFNPDGSFTYEVTLGENRWEEFHIIQDNNPKMKIFPHIAKATKKVATIGPHDGGFTHRWLLDCRDRVNVPDEQVGIPGDKYLVTFKWHRIKEVSWTKLEGETGDFEPGKYYIAGSWNDMDPAPMEPVAGKRPGWFSTEVQMTSLGMDFKFMRNEDPAQVIYPVIRNPADSVSKDSPIGGPDDGATLPWSVQDRPGTVYKISFFRDPDDCESSAMRVDWAKAGERPVVEPEPKYYLVGIFNGWGEKGYVRMAPGASSTWTGEVPLDMVAHDPLRPEELKPGQHFHILQHKLHSRCVHPDKPDCIMRTGHKVLMDGGGQGFSWAIGKANTDKAQVGDKFIVTLQISKEGGMKVSWEKARLKK
mmetsp:Transcript_83798/g.179578  ORF Transcript_83798/g.179578 Transcript_83798/m.179578 type:complete len:980 (+) Transcript_83798:100-3039(+)